MASDSEMDQDNAVQEEKEDGSFNDVSVEESVGTSRFQQQRAQWADIARRRAAHFARADADESTSKRRKRLARGLQHPKEQVVGHKIRLSGNYYKKTIRSIS